MYILKLKQSEVEFLDELFVGHYVTDFRYYAYDGFNRGTHDLDFKTFLYVLSKLKEIEKEIDNVMCNATPETTAEDDIKSLEAISHDYIISILHTIDSMVGKPVYTQLIEPFLAPFMEPGETEPMKEEIRQELATFRSVEKKELGVDQMKPYNNRYIGMFSSRSGADASKDIVAPLEEAQGKLINRS